VPGFGPVRDDDTEVVVVINPAIDIVKTPNVTQAQPGDDIVYSYAVTNPGDDPLDVNRHDTNTGVVDDTCTTVVYVSGDTNNNDLLDTGETWNYICTYTNIQQDTTNVATASGTDSLGGPVTDQDTAFVDVLIPGLAIAKSVDKSTIYADDTVIYSYEVTNSGDPVYHVQVSDDKCSPLVYVDGDDGDGVLQNTETWRYTCTTSLSVDTVNVATAAGTSDPGGLVPVTPAQDSETVNVINPSIEVLKSVDASVVTAGSTVNYTFVVNNIGDDPLSNISLTDWVGANPGCTPVYQSGDTNNDTILDTDESWTYTCTGVVINSDTTNVVTATGLDTLGNPVSDNDSEFVDVVDPQIAVVKTANPLVVLPGDLVQYSYLVSNPGDTPLADIDMDDNTCSPISGPDPSGDLNGNGLLDPGETWAYTCTTPVTDDTRSTITATGTPSSGLSPLWESSGEH